MSKRVRMTRRQAADDQQPYPGSINQPGRVEEGRKSDDYEIDSYEVPGWELQDLPTKFDDQSLRNSIGFTEQTSTPAESRKATEARTAHVQRVRVAASKAVRLAVLLLGDKVPEKMIEGQAHELMRLGDVGLSRALKRYAMTSKLYAEEEEVVEEEITESKKAEEEEVVEEEIAESKKATSDDRLIAAAEALTAIAMKLAEDDDDEDEEEEAEEAEEEAEEAEEEAEETEETEAKKKKAEDQDEEAEEDMGAKKKSEMSEETKKKFEENAQKVKDGEKPGSKKKKAEGEEEAEEAAKKKAEGDDDIDPVAEAK